ncbi:MAG: 23S rRNA (adenine(2503)-C(2))-methyltransferase RlmN, partial [Candidatus Puniceispirillum sp.]
MTDQTLPPVSDADERINLLGLSLATLTEQITAAGLPKFRAKQIWRWVWRHGLTNFDEMSDLGKPVRAQMASMYKIDRPAVSQRLNSKDGTIKWLLRFPDGNEAEAVYIP